MKKLKIYLDTSVLSFYYADDAPDFKKATIEFFHSHINKFEVFISDIVLFEINKTVNEQLKENLINIIDNYPVQILNINTEEIFIISELYIKEKVIPKNKREDALHIAISTFYEMDVLLSWNFKHLANINKQLLINSINEKEGYLKKLNLLNPLEVIYEIDDE